MTVSKAIYAAAAALAVTACTNEAPDAGLSISLGNEVCKAGEPVTFRIDGEADNIIFYSGEPGHEYSLRNRQFADNDMTMEFVSYTDQSAGVVNNMQVLVSADFSGVYTPEEVSSATWTDVTGLFTLPDKTGQNTPSGTASLKSYAGSENNDLIYVAFRYKDIDGEGVRNRWVVRSMSLVKVSPEGGRSEIADIKTAGWQNVVVSGTAKWTLPGSQLLASGNASTGDKEFWAVSAGFNIHTSEPSSGVVLKNIATDVEEFSYTYEVPGVYEAVFASSSVWYNSENSSTATVKLTVIE